MKMRNLYILFCFAISTSFAQIPIKTFEWRDHLNYATALKLAQLNNHIYGLVPNSGIIDYNLNDNSLNRMNKVTGLSDVNPMLIRANNNTNQLLIAYENGNIDIIKGNEIVNVVDLYRKSIVGDKTVYDAYFKNEFAYLCCGFGIVVLDMNRNEIKDTYIIGPNGSQCEIYAFTELNGFFYAATNLGIYRASVNNINLADFQNWTKIKSGKHNFMISFNNNLIVNRSDFNPAVGSTYFKDSILVYNGSSFSLLPNKPFGYVTYSLSYINSTHFGVCASDGVIIGNTSFTNDVIFGCYSGVSAPYMSPREMVCDNNLQNIHIADIFGFFKINSISGCGNATHIKIDGPDDIETGQIKFAHNKMYWVQKDLTPNIGVLDYQRIGLNIFSEGSWTNKPPYINTAGDTITYNYNCLAVDPDDENHVYVGSWNEGIVEYNGSTIKNYWIGSPLPVYNFAPNYKPLRIGNLMFDEDKNLWATTGPTAKFLSVRKPDLSWTVLNFSSFYPSSEYGSWRAIIDKSKQVWQLIPGAGICVYKHDGSFAQPNNSNTKKITDVENSGKLPSLDLNAIVEDKEGDIWVGTYKGVAVFYNPESIFTNTNGWDAQQIFIEQDGKTQILLETDIVTCIAVDDHNNKWIGTKTSGVYQLSPDGQKEIHHFTETNSPLFSNNVDNIAIDPKTGEVFFGTAKGLQSFQNYINKGGDKFEDVYAFPNPVKPNYDGPILMHGLSDGVIVKIVDAAGNFVYETKSEGGQAIWYAKNFKGERVSSGVYLALFSTSAGEVTSKTKIVVLN